MAISIPKDSFLIIKCFQELANGTVSKKSEIRFSGQ
jgi:hypothetical protein